MTLRELKNRIADYEKAHGDASLDRTVLIDLRVPRHNRRSKWEHASLDYLVGGVVTVGKVDYVELVATKTNAFQLEVK